MFNISAKIWFGVLYPNLFLGLLFKIFINCCVCIFVIVSKLDFLRKYCLISPFSLAPLYQLWYVVSRASLWSLPISLYTRRCAGLNFFWFLWKQPICPSLYNQQAHKDFFPDFSTLLFCTFVLTLNVPSYFECCNPKIPYPLLKQVAFITWI